MGRLRLSAPDEPLGFETKLAHDNGWTLGHARAVTEEYRRFLALAPDTGAPPCPSDDVDRAWRLHITRSTDYARFCAHGLGGFLHRDPPADEAERRRGYKALCRLYRQAFGRDAPETVWPPRADGHAPRASRRGGAVVRWPLASAAVGDELRLAMLLLAAATGLAGSASGLTIALEGIGGPAFLALVVSVLVVLVFAWRYFRPRDPEDPRAVLDDYEAAWLTGGSPRLLATATASLIASGCVRTQVDGASSHDPSSAKAEFWTRCLVVPGAQPPTHPVERALLESAEDGELLTTAPANAMAREGARIERRLVAAGLLHDRSVVPAGRLGVKAATALLLGLEGARIAHGMTLGHPVFFLVVLTVITLFLLLPMSFAERRSARGQAACNRAMAAARESLRERWAKLDLAKPEARGALAASLPLPVLGVAMLGGEAVAGDPRFADLAVPAAHLSHLAWPTRGGDGSGGGCSSGGGCGSSCGGGCGGGGCGG